MRDRPRVHYSDERYDTDPYPDTSLLDTVSEAQHSEALKYEERMLQTAEKNGFPKEFKSRLRKITYGHIDIFLIAFASGAPARFLPLHIKLFAESAPTKCRLRNYSAQQQKFVRSTTSKLMAAEMIFLYSSGKWAAAPLIVPNPGDAKFRFTVDLRAVNRFTIPHYYPMPNLGNELARLQGSRYFANYDLSQG